MLWYMQIVDSVVLCACEFYKGPRYVILIVTVKFK
jgi:hypothetical protein